jgi:hypothetical protein
MKIICLSLAFVLAASVAVFSMTSSPSSVRAETAAKPSLLMAAGRILRGDLMSQFAPGATNARFFGLDVGDWSVLVGGFALAGLVLFLTYPVAG